MPTKSGRDDWQDQPTMRCDYARILARELDLKPADTGPLLQGTALTPRALARPETLLSATDQIRIFANALKLSRNDGLGLLYGRRLTASAHGAVGYMASSSATLYDAIRAIATFLPARVNYLLLDLEPDDRQGWVDVVAHFPFPLEPDVARFLADALCASFSDIAHQIAGSLLDGVEAHVAHPKPPYAALYRELAPLTYVFDAGVNRIRIPMALCRAPNIQADNQAFELARQQCQQLLDQTRLQTATGLRHSVERLMLSGPPGTLTADAAAAALFMSPRTLARRLADEGTTFRRVREHTLSRQAATLVAHHGLPVEAIAAHLNFHDSASFRRAFKRWFGMPPDTFRKTRQNAL